MLVYVLMFLLDTTPPVKRRPERPGPRRMRSCVMGPHVSGRAVDRLAERTLPCAQWGAWPLAGKRLCTTR